MTYCFGKHSALGKRQGSCFLTCCGFSYREVGSTAVRWKDDTEEAAPPESAHLSVYYPLINTFAYFARQTDQGIDFRSATPAGFALEGFPCTYLSSSDICAIVLHGPSVLDVSTGSAFLFFQSISTLAFRKPHCFHSSPLCSN